MPLRKTERLFQVLDAIVPALCLIRSGEFLIREVTQSMIIGGSFDGVRCFEE